MKEKNKPRSGVEGEAPVALPLEGATRAPTKPQEVKERILCLDVGTKRIGVAVSDPLGFTAQGLATLTRRHFKMDCRQILQLLKEYGATALLLGLPIDLENQEGPQAKKIRFFAEGLKKFLKENNHSVEIEWWDESFSSQDAEAILLEADLSRKKRRKVIDKLAATLILQSYLDQKR